MEFDDNQEIQDISHSLIEASQDFNMAATKPKQVKLTRHLIKAVPQSL